MTGALELAGKDILHGKVPATIFVRFDYFLDTWFSFFAHMHNKYIEIYIFFFSKGRKAPRMCRLSQNHS